MPQTDVLAAGAVVFRPGKRVLLVHRPRYDDWSFPKGKLDRGEHVTAAAVREVAEETGLHVRLGPPLAGQRYRMDSGRTKSVAYWTGRVVGDDDVTGYAVNAEIDAVEWVGYDEALDRLTYDYDRDTLREAGKVRRRTHPLVVLRHAEARSRKAWRQDDRLRPLLQAGRGQAQKLVPVLGAYAVSRVVSSSSTRCVESVGPYADTTGWPLNLQDGLTEEAATPKSVARVVGELVAAGEGAVLCTHRPVLPAVFDALGVKDPGLEPGGMLVAHLRKGTVQAIERQLVR
jgi:8-oxo-dGTP diphosphatase